MTQGVLIFAFNNEQTDYLAMAEWSAHNVRRHLNLPTSVVTNAKYTGTAFDHVIYADAESGGTRYFEDYNSTVTWHNAGRVDAYRLTAFSETPGQNRRAPSAEDTSDTRSAARPPAPGCF
jgi:hypothetical protein